MNRHTHNGKPKHIAKTAPASGLFEVIYADSSVKRAPALPKQSRHIAYVRQIGHERRYLIPQNGQWIEVSEEVALQRAEGLRRARPSWNFGTAKQLNGE